MERNKLIDIVKCIGIISVVIGHSTWNVLGINAKFVRFVYMYHLMIFIFVSGYLFPREKIKNRDEIYKYIGKHIYKMLTLFVVYNFVFVILHNSIVKTNIINTKLYTPKDIIEKSLNGLFFRSNEEMLGAFWFIPMLLMTEMLFVISVNIINKFKNNKYLHLAFPLIFAIVGLILCYEKINLLYKLQISIISVPFMYMGMFTKKYWLQLEKYIFKFGWIISAIILGFIIEMKIGNIELYRNQIINPFLFYPVSLVGIYFCFSLAKMFKDIVFLEKGLCYIGENSFHIMALHFLFIKIIDIIYDKTDCITNMIFNSNKFFNYLNTIWPIFILLITCLPVILIYIIKRIKSIIKEKCNVHQESC